MRGGIGRYAIIVALVAGFLAAMAHVRYLKGLTQMQNVVVVTQKVGPYQLLSESNLALESVPVGSVKDDTLTRIEDAKGHYSAGLLLKGAQVRKEHLADANGGTLSTRLTATGDPNIRAMALRVSADTGVANALGAGDQVDVLVTFKGDKSTISRIIARNVPVLLTPTTKSDGGLTGGGGSDSTVVLQVTPVMAEEIAFAQTSGMIWLLLSPYTATAETGGSTGGVTSESFLKRYGAQVVLEAAKPKEGR